MIKRLMTVILSNLFLISTGLCLAGYAQGQTDNEEYAEFAKQQMANNVVLPMPTDEVRQPQAAEDTASLDIWGELERVNSQIELMAVEINNFLDMAKDETATEEQVPIQFNKFKQEHENTVTQTQIWYKTASDVRSRAELYFEGWQRELEAIENSSLRNRGEGKRDKKFKIFVNFNESIQKTKVALDQLIIDLQDIIHYLRFNLRIESVRSIASELRKLDRNASKIQREISKTEEYLQELSLLPEIINYKRQ